MTVEDPVKTVLKNNYLNSIKNQILPTSFNTEPDKVGEKQINTEEPCSLVLSTTSRQQRQRLNSEFDLAFVFSPIIPVIKRGSRAQSIINRVDIEKIGKVGELAQNQNAPNAGYRKYLGLFLALLATFIYSLATLIVKLLKHYHPFTVSVWRFQGFIIPSIPIILYHVYSKKAPVFGTILPLTEKKNVMAVFLILLRSIVGCSSSIMQIYAVQMMNMADASVIVFSSPVFVTLVAHVLLGEKAGIFSIVCALFTFSGVVVIARPPMLTGESMDEQTLIGSGLALGSMLLATLVYIILRYLREVHYSVVTISYGILGSIESVILAIIFDVVVFPQEFWEWILALGLILFTFAGQTCLILALKFEEAGPVSLINTTDVVFAFIWQLMFLSVYPDLYSVTGAVIVILGVSTITIRKWMVNLPADHPTRIRFAFCFK